MFHGGQGSRGLEKVLSWVVSDQQTSGMATTQYWGNHAVSPLCAAATPRTQRVRHTGSRRENWEAGRPELGADCIGQTHPVHSPPWLGKGK